MREEHLDFLSEIHRDVVLPGPGDVAGNLAGVFVLLAGDGVCEGGVSWRVPYFFASPKVAIALAFVGSVIAETVASNRGIGYLKLSASSNYNIPLVFAGLVVLSTLGVLMYVAAAALGRRTSAWAFRGSDLNS